MKIRNKKFVECTPGYNWITGFYNSKIQKHRTKTRKNRKNSEVYDEA